HSSGNYHRLRSRKHEGKEDTFNEAHDYPVQDREVREQRDLLRGDRADDRLVRVGRERRAEAGQPGDELVQGLIGVRPLVEGVELEVGADDRSRDRLGLLVQRLDVDSAGRGFDPQLATADHSVDTALVPEVREVGAEGSKPFGGELEVVRLGQAKQSQVSERTTSYRVSKRS